MTDIALCGSPARQADRLDIDLFLRRLEARLQTETERLIGDIPVDGLFSLTVFTPELASAHVQGLCRGDIYWSKPASGLLRIGVGQALTWEAKGRNRWSTLNERLIKLQRHWLSADPDNVKPEQCAFVGLAFDPEAAPHPPWDGIPNSVALIPEILYTRKGLNSHLTFNLVRRPDTDMRTVRTRWFEMARDLLSRLLYPQALDLTRTVRLPLRRAGDDGAAHHWSAQVGAALNAIKRAEFEKVVLTRSVKVEAPTTFNLGRILAWLETRYPGCIHFAVPLADKMLVGVTPERLISLSSGTAVADAIAGTRPRQSEQSRPDNRLNPLLNDLKMRREQRLVVEGILGSLKPVSHDLITARQPLILSLPNVQHLWSPIQAKIRNGVTLLDLAERLHPTPAVSGMPRDRALQWLKTQGEQWRGWYTGAVGWATRQGEGELAVALRCALLDGNTATLFAGAGILRESDPQQEYLETEWKLQSMLEALEHG